MRYSCLTALLFSVLIITSFSCTPSEKYLREKNIPSGYENNFVRVLVSVESGSFRINSGSALTVRQGKAGRLLYDMKDGRLVFYPEKMNGIYLVESKGAPLYLNGRGYRGTFELHSVLGKIHVVNVVNIEEYLYSVVPSEMPSSWNIEALKAQAVASRTYTYYYLLKDDSRKIYDVDATTSFQVYKGIASETENSTSAVRATAGVIMVYNHAPILAYFHSTSGGKTADDKYVWKGDDLPYLEGVRCTYSKESPHYEWQLKLTVAEIETALKRKYSRVGRIRGISFKKYDDRVYEVEITHEQGTITMSGNDFRIMVSPSKLKSTYFRSEKRGGTLYISGKGWGHGVGMCQWGAKGRAEAGQDYSRILSTYYKGINFKKISNNYLAQMKGSGNHVN
ncbi:MAG TPA: SpoIID/LytB domain-containing protein [Spirochaetota bacterium]|nr:SpoIID/LytB domain-containing protein [Spirochaetota bacterium]